MLKSSNRTFMELKFWYHKFKNFGFSGSNRTFMELKSVSRQLATYPVEVLIVPLWN